MSDLTPDRIRENCRILFRRAGVEFNPVVHPEEEVLDYRAASRVHQLYQLVGEETKCLFLRGRDDHYFMLLTLVDQRVKWPALKSVAGQRLSLASSEDLTTHTGCVPGNAVPFGLPKNIAIIIDVDAISNKSLVVSTGLPTETLQLTDNEVAKLLNAVENEILAYRPSGGEDGSEGRG